MLQKEILYVVQNLSRHLHARQYRTREKTREDELIAYIKHSQKENVTQKDKKVGGQKARNAAA